LFDPITISVILVFVGLSAGTVGSILGVGGGIIMVPALTIMGLPPTQISITSLFAVTSTSVSSTIEYSRQKRINYRLGLEMAAFSIPGAIIGAFLSEFLSLESFKLYFGILLMLTATYLLYRKSILKENTSRRKSSSQTALVFVLTFGAGITSSLFGVGGGIIYMPAMILILGMTIQHAAPISQFTLIMTSFAGLFTHIYLGHPDYFQALALSIGAFAGGQIGARLSRTAKEAVLRKLLGLILIGTSVKLIFDWLLSM